MLGLSLEAVTTIEPTLDLGTRADIFSFNEIYVHILIAHRLKDHLSESSDELQVHAHVLLNLLVAVSVRGVQ